MGKRDIGMTHCAEEEDLDEPWPRQARYKTDVANPI